MWYDWFITTGGEAMSKMPPTLEHRVQVLELGQQELDTTLCLLVDRLERLESCFAKELSAYDDGGEGDVVL
jgi:hypothetical protein